MFNSRLFFILLLGCLFIAAPMSQASVFGAIAKIFKGSDEAAQVAGKSDEAAAAMKAADETTHAADDIPLATKEATEHSDDIPLASKEEQSPATENIPEDSTTEVGTDVVEEGSMIGEVAKEATMQIVGAMAEENAQTEEEQESE